MKLDFNFLVGSQNSPILLLARSCSAIFTKSPQTNAIDVKKTPENKHQLYQFLEAEEFNFDGPQYYSDDVLAVPVAHNMGPSSEADFSEYRCELIRVFESFYANPSPLNSFSVLTQHN